MLTLSRSCRYFLYRLPCDMRLGIYSLAGLVRNELGQDPLSGDVFVFLGKRGIVVGQLPGRVIEKGIPSDRVVAQMALDKYVYGLPLHRQIDKYRRMGVNIPASTASDWLLKGWKHLIPLWELLKLLVINQKYLQADESSIKVLDRNHKSGVHLGYMWVYNAPADGLVLFDYRKGRDHTGPKEVLKDYRGILQTDGYSVYEKLYGQHPHILLVYCMAHARRKFVDALT